MKLRSLLCSLIGLWFIVAPWLTDFSTDPGAVWSSVLAGAVLFISSAAGYGKPGWGSWWNWLSLLSGVWILIFSMLYEFAVGQTFIYLLFGLATVLMSFYNMEGSSLRRKK